MQRWRGIIAVTFAVLSAAAIVACSGELTGPEPSTAASFDWQEGQEIFCEDGYGGNIVCTDGVECVQADSDTYVCDNGCTVERGDQGGVYCPGDGGDPCYEDCGSSGGGDPPPPPPPSCDPATEDCPDEPPAEVDESGHEELGLIEPDCNAAPPLKVEVQAWCAGQPPSPAQRLKIDNAIARMRAKGGICAALATIADSVVRRGDLRIYRQEDFSNFGGAAPNSGGATGSLSWIAFSDAWTEIYYDAAHATSGELRGPRTLQFALAHEADHLNGEHHVGYLTSNEDKSSTPNSRACSDLA